MYFLAVCPLFQVSPIALTSPRHPAFVCYDRQCPIVYQSIWVQGRFQYQFYVSIVLQVALFVR